MIWIWDQELLLRTWPTKQKTWKWVASNKAWKRCWWTWKRRLLNRLGISGRSFCEFFIRNETNVRGCKRNSFPSSFVVSNPKKATQRINQLEEGEVSTDDSLKHQKKDERKVGLRKQTLLEQYPNVWSERCRRGWRGGFHQFTNGGWIRNSPWKNTHRSGASHTRLEIGDSVSAVERLTESTASGRAEKRK